MSPRLSYSPHRHASPGAQLPALECRAATVRYPGSATDALREVDLVIASGEHIALIGPNGSGKSTLLKAAAGVLPLSAGSISVHGSKPGGCCHRVAYLAQRGELDWRFPMTVSKLVLSGRYVHLGWFARPGPEDRGIAHEVMEQLQIADLADKPIGELSGGQQQRTLLARALAQEAQMLLLDEPTNAVDRQTRQIIRGLLASLAAQGKTIVVATHDPHDIEFQFDRIIEMSEGRIIGQTTRMEPVT
jgi:manganese/zinc/iron transport system ATP- binding protein